MSDCLHLPTDSLYIKNDGTFDYFLCTVCFATYSVYHPQGSMTLEDWANEHAAELTRLASGEHKRKGNRG